MILYVNGDSNCFGTDLKDPNMAWPNLLAKQLNANLINHSRPGASNTRILRTTNDFLSNHYDKNVLVIIGTTSWEREEWPHDSNFFDVNASTQPQILPEPLRDRFRQWILDQNDTVCAYKSNDFHQEFYDLHKRLTSLQIGHVFFHGFNPFMDGADYKSFEKYNWGKNFISPYSKNNCYYWYLKDKGYCPTDNFHHLEDAQLCWAEFLYQYLKENKII